MSIDLSRARLLLGEEALLRLANTHVAIFGLGGVGSFAAEAIARAGVGHITLVDKDTVDPSNVNRQLLALSDTIGQQKTALMRERILRIHPEAEVLCRPIFFGADTVDNFDFSQYDYVLDAIDTVSAKLLLVERCYEAGTPLASSMGTGNKLDPTRFEVADIYETSVCPLARVMRRELKRRGIPSLQVVYSREVPLQPREKLAVNDSKLAPGSLSFVPPVAGMILAGVAIRAIAGIGE